MDKPVALVTGASRGIGRACAVELARRGHFVVAAWVASEDGAKRTLEQMEAVGGAGKTVQLDVSDIDACAAVVQSVLGEYGRLDVLVNNAAVSVDALIVRLKNEDWDRQLAVNLTGPMALCRSAARPMMKQRAGSIVNLVSVVGEMGNAGQSAYAAAKSGLVGFTKSLARELGARKVRVNAVSPGFIATDMTSRLTEDQRSRILDQVPLARLGTSEEVAKAVAFLATDDAAYITGQVLRVNGGLLT